LPIKPFALMLIFIVLFSISSNILFPEFFIQINLFDWQLKIEGIISHYIIYVIIFASTYLAGIYLGKQFNKYQKEKQSNESSN
jgi:hypothetical protein